MSTEQQEAAAGLLREMTRTGTGLVVAADTASRGIAPGDLQRAVRSRSLHRLRRGVYVDGALWQGVGPAGRHLLRVRAVAAVRPDLVFSHRSAAAAWRLPLLGPWSDRVEVVRGPATGGRSTSGVRRHAVRGTVPAVVHDGLLVTDPVRTVVDLACTEPFASALVAADQALRAGVLAIEPARAELDRRGPARGVRGARRVLDLADPRAESAGESLSRARMIEHGIVAPELQHEFRDGIGVVARVDFWWPDAGVVGEFDGRLKYRAGDEAHGGVRGGDRPAGPPAEERVWAEKLREDRLRERGLRVIRWTWREALLGVPLAERLRAAGLAAR